LFVSKTRLLRHGEFLIVETSLLNVGILSVRLVPKRVVWGENLQADLAGLG
jgi:hypothetical protein